MPNHTQTCPPPFLNLAHFPSEGGHVNGRFCGEISETLSCCLPCPLVQWLYPDWLFRSAKIASWFNVPALVCQVFLLLTFLILPQEKAHGRYLSVGLCVSLIFLELAFIIPLGVQPDVCYNAITPKDMHSSLTCAWSGALLEVGSMAACVWILLRSLYTHLRVCWDIELTNTYMWIAQALGWGLPMLFLAVSLPVTGLSYRLISTCSPNPHKSFATWFAWLIAFAMIGALIQFGTTAFCLIVYARTLLAHSRESVSQGSKTSESSAETTPTSARKKSTPVSGRRLAWLRVKKILVLQWRSILLSSTVIFIAAYSGIIYVVMTRTAAQDADPKQTNKILNWSDCLVEYAGEKSQCLYLTDGLRLGAGQVIAALIMGSLIGIFTFGLMLRRSMLVSWMELWRDPSRFRNRRNSLGFDFADAPTSGPKQISLSRPLASEQAEEGEVEAKDNAMPVQMPEPGDVANRHRTMDAFEFDFDHEAGKRISRIMDQDDVV